MLTRRKTGSSWKVEHQIDCESFRNFVDYFCKSLDIPAEHDEADGLDGDAGVGQQGLHLRIHVRNVLVHPDDV